MSENVVDFGNAVKEKWIKKCSDFQRNRLDRLSPFGQGLANQLSADCDGYEAHVAAEALFTVYAGMLLHCCGMDFQSFMFAIESDREDLEEEGRRFLNPSDWDHEEWERARIALTEISAADRMLAYLIERADKLLGAKDSAKKKELKRLIELIDTYEARRWPSGKVAGGKG